MKHPRVRFDGLPIWPVPALLAVGGLFVAAARGLHRLAVLIDDAHDTEE